MGNRNKASDSRGKLPALKKRRLMVLFTLVLVLTLTLQITLDPTHSILKAITATLNNTFAFGTSDIEIIEPGVDPDDIEWSSTSKPVYISNPADSVDSVVRMTFVPVFTDKLTGEPANITTLEVFEPEAHRMELGDITMIFYSTWSDSWIYKDGWFYYNTVLESGTTSTKLLSGVVLTNDTPEMRLKYQNIDVHIEVLAESLQAEGDAPSEWGLSVDSSGNVTLA